MHVNLLFKKIAALIPCLLLTVALNAQTVTKAFRSVPLKTVLEEVERQTGYSILFENEDVDVSRPVTATFKDATLQTVLDTVLDKSLRYTVKGGGKLVTISRRSPVSAPTAPNGEMTVAGTVISSADNQPIVGANIYVEGTNVGTTTDAGGNYKLTVPASAKTVTVSFLGYDTKKISVRDIHLFKLITLADASNKLEDVVVVGFGVQKKESLVGEGIRPEFIALINYGIVGIIQLEKGYVDEVDITSDEALQLYDKYALEALQLMTRKNHDYDEAWRSMRVSSYTDFILTKIQRVKEIEDIQGDTLVSEGIDANYMDIINYAVFGVIKMSEE